MPNIRINTQNRVGFHHVQEYVEMYAFYRVAWNADAVLR